MTADTFTRAEIKAIGDAYSAISYETECTNWSDAPLWRDALKLERPQRNTIHDAKALLVECFAAGMNRPVSARNLYGMARGCIFATVLGAGMTERSTFTVEKLDALNVLFRAAAEAYAAQSKRYLDAISGRAA